MSFPLEKLSFAELTLKTKKKFKGTVKKKVANEAPKPRTGRKCKFFLTAASCKKAELCTFEHTKYLPTTELKQMEKVETEQMERENLGKEKEKGTPSAKVENIYIQFKISWELC